MSLSPVSATEVCGLLLTYLLHSTVVIGLVAVILRLGTSQHSAKTRRDHLVNPEIRVLIWKSALVLPIVTTVVVAWGGVPHFGTDLILGSPSVASEGTQLVPRSLETSAAGSDELVSGWAGQSISPAFASNDRETEYLASQQPLTARDGAPDRSQLWQLVCGIWIVAVLIGSAGLVSQLRYVNRIRSAAASIRDPLLNEAMVRLQRRLGIRRSVDLLESTRELGPLAAGIFRPFILLPCGFAAASNGDSDSAETAPPTLADQRNALLAHELVHIARGDALWNLITQLIIRTFCFQPLNRYASRQLRKDMDFVADQQAVRASGERKALAQCLCNLGERLARRPSDARRLYGLASCAASFHSLLGQRIESLLGDEPAGRSVSAPLRTSVIATMILVCTLAASLVPRAIAQPPSPEQHPHARNQIMKNYIATIIATVGLAVPGIADDGADSPQAAAQSQTVELRQTPDDLPAGIENFNGMLVGRLAAKDVEKGSFVVLVDAVPRVWRNSKAEDPKSLVGKTVKVDGVFGKFLDVLVVMKEGETIEFEARHDGGDQLTFPGELLRKVEPYDPSDYPELPETFRGFAGGLAAEIIKKDPETFELIVKVERVLDTWKDSDAKEPKSIEGKAAMLAGFWNRKDTYYDLKVGDRIEVGVRHIGRRSDHLNVAEFVRKAKPRASSGKAMMKRESGTAEEGLTEQLRGFRGMLVGRLVSKDVERGEFTITVDAVPRVWKNNEASQPKNFIGKNVTAERVSGRMLDALVVAKKGDTFQLGAFHEGGDKVRVVEVLRKVAPVEPGDYPDLPDGFRGFKGLLTAKVVEKGEHLLDLVIEVKSIDKTFPGSSAENPESIVGQRAMLTGFWNRRDAFHGLQVGDVIQCGVEHPQTLSDHLSVFETFRKKDE